MGMKGVIFGCSLDAASFVAGRFIPRLKLAIISRASSLRLFFFMMKLLFLNFQIEIFFRYCLPTA
jgi:hypothetical protein